MRVTSQGVARYLSGEAAEPVSQSPLLFIVRRTKG